MALKLDGNTRIWLKSLDRTEISPFAVPFLTTTIHVLIDDQIRCFLLVHSVYILLEDAASVVDVFGGKSVRTGR